MLNTSVGEFFPDVYKDITEIDQLVIGEDNVFHTLFDEMDRARANQYVSTAYLEGVEEYEKILGILASPSTETLAFRRSRILNRLATRPPYTLEFLQARFDEIIGVGAYTITMDYANYTLYIESAAQDADWFHEILVTVNRIKPANIAFVSRSAINGDIKTSEVISIVHTNYNYNLGHWFLGQKAFVSTSEEVKKLASVLSVNANLLQAQAEATVAEIAKVKINDTLVITTFTTKEAASGVATIQYTVPISSGITTITNIKLLDSSDNVLCSAPVYIPISIDTALKHNITNKEGV